MNISRAPRGIPTGGQFVSTSHSEPTVSLVAGGPARRPDEAEAAPARNIGFLGGGRQIMDWDTNEKVDYDSLSEDEQARVRGMAKEHGFPDPRRTGLRKTAEQIGDDVSETVDALGDAAGHFIDVQRGEVTPEVEGSFVGWGQMLPKFMRRKDREAKVTGPVQESKVAEPERESAEARNRRLAKVFADAARSAERMDSASARMRDLSGDR